MEKRHLDCKYYLPTDVFKGLCKHDKNKVNADATACERFSLSPKCRHCSHYSPYKEFTGLCMGNSLSWPDMNAKTCVDFKWKQDKN